MSFIILRLVIRKLNFKLYVVCKCLAVFDGLLCVNNATSNVQTDSAHIQLHIIHCICVLFSDDVNMSLICYVFVHFLGFRMLRLRSLTKISGVVNNAAFAGKLTHHIAILACSPFNLLDLQAAAISCQRQSIRC